MRHFVSLFDLAIDDEIADPAQFDLAYIEIADSEDCRDDRAYLDRAWDVHRRHADSEFVDQFRRRRHFQARAWELRIAWTLHDIGHKFHGPKPGPDFAIPLGDAHVYIEAVAPHATEELLAIHDAARAFGAAVPHEQIILRYTSAIEAKRDQHAKHLAKGILRRDDPFVVALSGANIPQSSVGTGTFPRILHPLFGIGRPFLRFPVDGKGGERTGVSRLTERRTPAGGSVRSDMFIGTEYRDLSAVMFSSEHVLNRPESQGRPPGDDLIVVHNPNADAPLPRGMIPRGREWGVREGRLELLQDWRQREAA
jgi:hypothetical protein